MIYFKDYKESLNEAKCAKKNCNGNLLYLGPGDYKRIFINGNPTDYTREANYQCESCNEITSIINVKTK